MAYHFETRCMQRQHARSLESLSHKEEQPRVMLQKTRRSFKRDSTSEKKFRKKSKTTFQAGCLVRLNLAVLLLRKIFKKTY